MTDMKAERTVNKILADLVAYRTISGEQQAASACLDYVGHYLTKAGMEVRRHVFNGFPSLVATTTPTKTPKLLLQAHMDVVAAPDKCFKLRQKGGKLYGRGVYDMKFAAAAFLKVVEDLQDKLENLDFGIMLTTDEEVGGKDGVKALLDEGYKAAVCILPDAGDNWQIEISHKGAWIGRALAKGVTAHGSRPWEGDNAIDRLIDALRAMRNLFDDQHTDSDTLSINKVAGGAGINQVADLAEATLDMRTVSDESFDRLHAKIKRIGSDHGVAVETLTRVRITETNIEHPLVAAFLQIAEEVRGKPLGHIRSLGTSDAHYFAKRGIPVILVRPDGGSPHGDDEWIDKAGLEQYCQVIKAYVEKVCAAA